MNTWLQDLRFAWRMLGKAPAFSAVAVLTIALGVGVNTSIFSLVNAVLLKPLPYYQPERLVELDEIANWGGGEGRNVSGPTLLDWQKQNHTFAGIAGFSQESYILSGIGEAQRLEGSAITANALDVVGVQPELGRGFTPADAASGAPKVAIISHALWTSLGSDRSLVGRTIRIDSTPYQVVGVMPAGFELPVQPTPVQIWLPLQPPSDEKLRGAAIYRSIGRLLPDVDIAKANADLNVIEAAIAEHQSDKDYFTGKVLIQPLKKAVVGEVRSSLWLLLGAVAFVLLIAAANLVNLFLARATSRQRELAIRVSLGATRARVLRQLLTESMLLATLGCGLGLLIASWSRGALVAISPIELPRTSFVRIDWVVLTFAIALSTLVAGLMGMAPLFQLRRDALSLTAKEQAPTAGRKVQFVRAGLVSLECTLALVLLTGAGLMMRTLYQLHSVAPGFDPSGLTQAEIALPKTKYTTPQAQNELFAEYLRRIQHLPGVQSAAAASTLPLSGANMIMLTNVEGVTQPKTAFFRFVSPEYLDTMRMRLAAGRWFTAADIDASEQRIVVNEALAKKYFKDANALGKVLYPPTFGSANDGKSPKDRPGKHIIGVVADVRFLSLDAKPQPEVYFVSNSAQAFGFMRFAIRSSGDVPLAPALHEQLRALEPELTLDHVMPVEKMISRTITNQNFYMVLLSVFAGLALFLAAIGLYGVMSYIVSQRQREIAIRMAVGGDAASVLRLFLHQSSRMVVIGLILGLAWSLALTRFIKSMLYGVKPFDPATLAAVSAVLLLAALAAAYLPARRATRVDPLLVLREE